MNLPDFQRDVAVFVAEHQLEAPVEVRVLDLVSEVGEVAKEVLKGNAYDHQSFQPTGEWQGELADAFFALICLTKSTTINLARWQKR